MYIFNFHYCEPHPKRGRQWDKVRKHITITPNGLRQFIRTLRRIGLKSTCLRDVIAAGGPGAFSDKHFLITFDDAYETVYHHALPVLMAEQCPATLFVIAHKIGATNDWDQGDLPVAQRDTLMSYEQLRDLEQDGLITLGSHGLDHVKYTLIDSYTLKNEINQSYQLLSQAFPNLFIPVIAYPWGAYSSTVLEQMPQSPYRYAFTVEKGTWTESSPQFEVPRHSIYYRDGNPFILLAKLVRNRILA